MTPHSLLISSHSHNGKLFILVSHGHGAAAQDVLQCSSPGADVLYVFSVEFTCR